MSLEAEIGAIRQSAATSRLEHVHVLRAGGPAAYDALEGVCPRELRLRDGQVMQTLLLRDDGTTFADLYVGCDGDSYLLLVDGPTRSQLNDYLGQHLGHRPGLEMEDLTASHARLGLDGPYAWEVAGALFGADVVGLPYLTLFHTDVGLCLRAGRTGEYGYIALVRTDQEARFLGALDALRPEFDLVWASREALDQCALENWFFNIRAEGAAGLTPLELQLQWRVSYRKEYVGAAALRARRGRLARRITTCMAREPLGAGAPVLAGEVEIGRILNAGFSAVVQQWVTLALLELPWAHPGAPGCTAVWDGRRVPLRTVSPPVIHNRSLFVSPREHSYRFRDQLELPGSA